VRTLSECMKCQTKIAIVNIFHAGKRSLTMAGVSDDVQPLVCDNGSGMVKV
jgi:hypothetical protein